MRVSLEFDGIEELSGQLKQNARLDDVRDVVKMSGAELQKKAMRKAPVDTGNLKRQITLSIEDDGMAAVVEPETEYAFYLEFGTGLYAEKGMGRKTPWVYYNDKLGHYVRTHGMASQPFMRPAFYEQRNVFIKDLMRLME